MPAQTRSACPQLHGLSVEPTVRALVPGYSIARWDRPSELGPRCRERLHVLLRDLAARAFGADHSGYWRSRMAGGFFEGVSTLALVLGPDGEVVGWGGYHRRRFARCRALYLDAAGIVPEHRRSGLSAALTLHFLVREVFARPWAPTYVLLRTRHPGVYAGWRKFLGAGRLFPNEYRPVPSRVRRLAGEAALWLGDGAGLEPQSLLVRDAYRMFEGCVYGREPACGEPGIDAYFAEQLGAKDAVMVVARVDVSVLAAAMAARWVRARVPGAASTAGPRRDRPSGAA